MSLRRVVVPAAVASLLTVLGACSSSATNLPVSLPPQVSALPPCRPGDNPLQLLAPAKLTGPAAGAVAAGRVTKSWSVDGGAIHVSPAPSASRPQVPMLQAACNLLASVNPNGFPLSTIAPNASTLGFGLLTVSPELAQSYTTQNGVEVTPVRSVFANRPAWILTTSFAAPGGCPAGPTTPPSRPVAPSKSWRYQVLALDAATGRTSITFIESAPQGCGVGENPASSTVPYEFVSVPWRPGSIAANRKSGQIQIFAPDCEPVPPGGARVGRSTPQVQVAAVRQLGAGCGPAVWRTLSLFPATVNALIPTQPTHAAVGAIDASTYTGS